MTLTSIGHISEINRYPVKSFAGETLQTSLIESYGLYGDRLHAFIDETKEGWSRYYTARQAPSMLSYKTQLIGEDSGERAPHVRVTSPDGRIFNWDEALLREIQAFSKRKLSMLTCKPEASELAAVDTGSILIITDSTLRKLEAMWGKRLDPRRFRANLVVTLDDESIHEGDWIGKQLSVGSAQLQVDQYCERCMMITIDPDTLEPDKSLLKKVNEELGLNFGVYASVKRTGQIHVWDNVFVAKGS
ncbi:MOSC domain-containing protein [Paenibacillus mendelii]|uniref:MOSC domain-containing protein n=2 Tax=Paenibacillus mendelii TaxID=206163 RepID=A0ABV6J9E3_9BACL